MAVFLLGKINIAKAHNTHLVGDLYEVFYDTDDFTYSVEKNGTPVTSGAGLFDPVIVIVSYYIRSFTGFTTTSFGQKYTFLPIASFPYFQTKVDPVIDEGVNDMQLNVVVVNESSPGAGDGKITATATGTNTPFQYSKDGISFSNSGVFTGLYASTYTIESVDSLGYKVQKTVIVENTSLIETDLGVKYRGDFMDAINGSGVLHRIDIHSFGYTGSVNTVELGTNPIVLSVRAEGTTPAVDINIFAHEAIVSLVSDTHKEYHEFGTAGEYDYQLRYYVDESAGKDGTDFQLRFKGYITPETYSEDYGVSPYNVSFTANDRLADLSAYDYRPSFFGTINTTSKYSGLASELSIIQNCLSMVVPQQKFKIALDMYETSMSDTNTTPLLQAFVDQSVYYNDDDAMKCSEVISEILKPYGAILFMWKGYTYIVKEEQFKQSSISINEFDVDLAYVGNESLSPRLLFKSTSGTSLFRWAGSQSLGFTRPVYSINIDAKGYIREAGIMPSLSPTFQGGFLNTVLVGVDGYALVTGNEVFQTWDSGWKITMVDESLSSTYIRRSSTLEYTSIDTLELQVEVNVDFYIGGVYVGFSPGNPAVYLVMKWQLQIGDKYLRVDGTWTTTPTINQFFIEKTDVRKDVTFNIKAQMPEGVTEATTEDYVFKVYAVSAWEYDELYGTQAAMIADMKDEADDSSYTSGSRRIVAHAGTGTYRYYYYYELAIAENSTNDAHYRIKATSSNHRYWELKGTWYEQLVTGQSGFNLLAGRTITNFRGFKFETFPSGENPPTDFDLIAKINNRRNARNLDIDLFHFDLTGVVNNEENIYQNYTRLSDGSPTTTWTRLGVGDKTRQEHLVDRLYELYSRPRYRFSGEFYSDVEISLLTVLYDSTDGGKLYLLNGIEINPKTGLHSGDILEIFSDTTLISGNFNDDFDTDNEFK